MRTPEQLNNLRSVFCRLYTPLAVYWPDESINFLANRIQDGVNRSAKWTWEIRVATEDDFGKQWKDIKKEPKEPVSTLKNIQNKCHDLLDKYPKILAILINAKENPNIIFQIQRN